MIGKSTPYNAQEFLHRVADIGAIPVITLQSLLHIYMRNPFNTDKWAVLTSRVYWV